MMDASVPRLSWECRGTGTVAVRDSPRSCMTAWLPFRRTSTNPWAANMRQTSPPDRTLSRPNASLEVRDEYPCLQTGRNFRRLGTFEEELDRLSEVIGRLLHGGTLAGDIQLRTQGDKAVALRLQQSP